MSESPIRAPAQSADANLQSRIMAPVCRATSPKSPVRWLVALSIALSFPFAADAIAADPAPLPLPPPTEATGSPPALAYRVEVIAPSPLKQTLERDVGLVRWQDYPEMTVELLDRLALEAIDVLFVSPTVHNMFTDRSMILINRLEPDYIFPQHFGTYRETDDNRFWTKGYPDELKLRLSKTLQDRFHKLAVGGMFVIR